MIAAAFLHYRSHTANLEALYSIVFHETYWSSESHGLANQARAIYSNTNG